MKIVVCIRQGLDGEINPFDACAYEEALRIKGAEITLLSMAPESARDFLLRLTRLGARRAVLLSDRAFAGADTLATAYTLSLAIKKLSPDLIFCGRQTLVGDTAQTGPMLSVYANASLITNVMSIERIEEKITCTTRDMGVRSVSLPALLTVERINTLRLPSIMSRVGKIEVWNAEDVGADADRCGLHGSPTRVIRTFENEGGRRKCVFIQPSELKSTVANAIEKGREVPDTVKRSEEKLPHVISVGETPLEFARTVCDKITVIDMTDADDIALKIREKSPDAVLWGSDSRSKELSARVSAMLGLGLCADCTELSVENGRLIMYRPALSGSIIAKIESRTIPAMATVRTVTESRDVIIAVGYGARDSLDGLSKMAESMSAEVLSTRKLVDNGYMPYHTQVGLTGRTVAPPVYVAVGVHGAVHHIAGMQRAKTVIAVNPDRGAPIFDYADFGILSTAEELLGEWN
ncbi:MAG: FAD-binding protein [Clostridia bacterium]|nr:FAD-binding protein [Clostridia bacterium]